MFSITILALIVLALAAFFLISATDLLSAHTYQLGCLGPDCPAENEHGTPFPTLEPEINDSFIERETE